MLNIATAPPLSAFVIIMSILFRRLGSASRSDFVRLSRESFLDFEDFISWLTAVMKVPTQLANLSGNQLLLLFNLGSFVLFPIDQKCAVSLTLP